jgi:hypothetical protein
VAEEHRCLFRQDLRDLDFVARDEKTCDAEIQILEGKIRHWCTRPVGHVEEHYSFSAKYEIVWPLESGTSAEKT